MGLISFILEFDPPPMPVGYKILLGVVLFLFLLQLLVAGLALRHRRNPARAARWLGLLFGVAVCTYVAGDLSFSILSRSLNGRTLDLLSNPANDWREIAFRERALKVVAHSFKALFSGTSEIGFLLVLGIGAPVALRKPPPSFEGEEKDSR
jgi:hypothetical protein